MCIGITFFDRLTCIGITFFDHYFCLIKKLPLLLVPDRPDALGEGGVTVAEPHH